MKRMTVRLLIMLLLVLVNDCISQNSKVLFEDPLDGTVVDGWIVAPDHFVDHPKHGKIYQLKCHGRRLTTPTPQVGDEHWENYRIETEVLVEERQGFVGLGYHSQNEKDHYCDFHFATWRDTTTMQAMAMWGNNKGSFKLYPWSQREINLKHGQWMKLRADVGKEIVNVYHEDTCVYTIYHMPFSCGGFRFWASYQGSAYFRNLRITALDANDIKPQLEDPWHQAKEQNVIRNWQITKCKPNTYAQDGLTEDLNLTKETWRDAPTDPRGVVNLSAIYPDYEKNTILAKTNIHAHRDKTIKAFVTYTDRFRLYCNGQEIFKGPDRNWYNDNRQKYGNSRLIPDQFEIDLPLKKGNNTIIVRSEVMEDFGWGFWMRTE